MICSHLSSQVLDPLSLDLVLDYQLVIAMRVPHADVFQGLRNPVFRLVADCTNSHVSTFGFMTLQERPLNLPGTSSNSNAPRPFSSL